MVVAAEMVAAAEGHISCSYAACVLCIVSPPMATWFGSGHVNANTKPRCAHCANTSPLMGLGVSGVAVMDSLGLVSSHTFMRTGA